MIARERDTDLTGKRLAAVWSQEASVELPGDPSPAEYDVGTGPADERAASVLSAGPWDQTTASEGRNVTTVGATKLLLTPYEAADQLAVSRTKVYELMAAGALRSIHIGRLRRVPVDALRDFIGAMESHERSGPTWTR